MNSTGGVYDMADKKKIRKIIFAAAGAAYVGLSLAAGMKKEDSIYADKPKEKNPLEGEKVAFVCDESRKENADGVRGYLVATGEEIYYPRVYEKLVKRGLDKILSFLGLIMLSPLMGAIAIAIKIEDPGPVLFTQKRLGQNKRYFKLHKFRSMRMDTPHDIPTHMLENPDQYITRVGRFIRAHSLDELPQIWDIFIGNMSVIGPRPALWNQDLLTAERDKYDANNVKPGLTGLAQINGRDELEISEKARLDGQYLQALNAGGAKAFKMDVSCFFGSLHVFGKDGRVVEGGTGELERKKSVLSSLPDEDTSPLRPKHILITGAGSHIGESVKAYLDASSDRYKDLFRDDQGEERPAYVTRIRDTFGWEPVPEDFEGVDVVFNVAGIAHVKETDQNRQLYYEINRDLVVKIAKAAKEAGVKQFILMSSMSVYGLTTGHITKQTEPAPNTAYGHSKLEADEQIGMLEDGSFKVAYLRSPMVYWKGCKGNYQALRAFALRSPLFPDCKNQRSMIYIGNLCEFVKRIIDKEAGGLFFPQNSRYVRTSEMVRLVAESNGKRIAMIPLFHPLIQILPFNIFKKVFGNLTYEHVDTVSKYSFEESIRISEGN